MTEGLSSIGRKLFAACLLMALVPWGLAQTTRDPNLAPAPEYRITETSLPPYQWGFTSPKDTGPWIEAWHLTLAWPDFYGNPTLHCPATAGRFDEADFVAFSPPSTWSQQTTVRSITRQQHRCTYDSWGNCVAISCGTDPWTYGYRMNAICDSGRMNFLSEAGKPRCECFAGQELERDAAGRWRCATPQQPSVANPNCYRHDGSCPAGNPVMPGVAAKVQTEADYEGAGAHPLAFTRSFRSQGARPFVEPGTWSHWVHNWARRIEVYPETGYKGRAYVVREDASQRIYRTDGTGTWSTIQIGDRNVLTEQRDASGSRTGFQYTLWADDSVEHYDTRGRLLRVVQRNGWTNALTYSDSATPTTVAPRPGLLIAVRNHFGRELRFTYDAAGSLAEMLPPGAVSGTAPGSAASPIRYLNNEPTGLGGGVPALNQLTSVVWQDGAVRRYHYENTQFPQWLTGRTDELGVRIGTYTYDTSGRLVRSEGPNGANAMDFTYGAATYVTDRSGAFPITSTYTWEEAAGVIRPVAVSAPCPQCGSTSASTAYSATGEVARRVEHDGKITFYSYDVKGRETERSTFSAAYNTATTRPALSAAESVVSTKWHSTWNLPTQVAEAGKMTAYTYGTGGRLTGESWTATTDATGAAKFNAVKTGSTYATGYGYSANHLNTSVVERADGVETQRWTLGYNAAGDLTRITDVTGGNLVGRATTYDGNGRLLSGTTKSGLSVSYAYSSRGFVTRRSVDSGTTTFTQNSIGLTTEVRLPDGKVVEFEYDATLRLINVRLDGAVVTGRTISAGEPETARLAVVRERLRKAVESLFRSAHAQALPLPPGPGAISSGMPLPGQPSTSPTGILLGDERPGSGAASMPPFDRRSAQMRWLAEKLADFCRCDPSGGFDRPTLTASSYVHIVMGGHTSPAFSNKSYFGEPVNQALVDEVVSKGTSSDSGSTRVYVVADMGRQVGYSRREDGTFAPERSVKLVVHRDNCNNLFRVRNEVITMYPGK